ncbi:HEAT repeat domain-containing protein [Limnoglobus roseus]|uniref:VCBS repeat-containing protein n=1 Tax=Limnoglobus roseus TaxID=2598579 RepID=A0A5C1AQ40_9BACT|nr:HEAT repeat domain-containing protein [Limnoglobus roseus]QEL20297.1 VCBS repeat-containing protein [Limnoglobus roseus]
MKRLILAVAVLAAVAGRGSGQQIPTTADYLKGIKAVGREGQGNDVAASCWKGLVATGEAALLPTLEAFAGANPTAANWLRSAVDAITEGEEKAGKKLPTEALRTFLTTTTHDPAARRIAYEVLAKADPTAAEKIILSLRDDPSVELRRDAIAKAIATLKDGDKVPESLFTAARDKDQVEEIGKRLNKSEADITNHFGFIPKWHVVGPFDNTKGEGFAKAYPPEQGVDLKATYDGKGGAKVTWKAATAKAKDKEYALVDLNAELTKHKDAVAYGFAVIEVAKETPVELRAGSITSIKMFVNGKEVFDRDEYHHGMKMDQHVGKATLKTGKNELLVKICQNNMTEPWAQSWAFQFRVCDATGGAIPFKLLSPEAK